MKKSNERKVFVFNGYGDTGGAFLNYHISRICHQFFGSPVFIVYNRKIHRKQGGTHPRFHYEFEFPAVDIEKMKQLGESDDIFICNPAHSLKWFGPRLPMKKLMYVQGINTYPVLDIYFDYYVSVSRFVQDHIRNVFNVKSQVISPFINHDIFKNTTPWEERKNDILILNYKGYAGIALQHLYKLYKEKYPESGLSFKVINHTVSQEELAEAYNRHRYFLTLNPNEGFGLPPLEAMASGCAVIGFDSMGGRDYFEQGKNAIIVPYGDFEQLMDVLSSIEKEPDYGKTLAIHGIETAKAFTYERFLENWLEFLSMNVYKAPPITNACAGGDEEK